MTPAPTNPPPKRVRFSDLDRAVWRNIKTERDVEALIAGRKLERLP